MADVLGGLVAAAVRENQAGVLLREDGMHVLAYPHDGFIVLGVGMDAEAACRLPYRALLQRRRQDLQRYGRWIPCIFNDGKFFLVARFPRVELETGPVEMHLLSAAEELMS
ncbi:MAG TPA: hypothetical protein VIM12_13555 [Noviherbaspirillum sp.]|jgi:hypothetical protein|uniref:hypothetical protein n=1 Tax=Noviherbaspirillum sp. TaxID=1926288 RepID=UPI002F95525C